MTITSLFYFEAQILSLGEEGTERQARRACKINALSSL
jgi:hypothetical protein